MDFGEASLSTKLLDRFGRIFPKQVWIHYSDLAASQGFDRLYLLLSFDCDTPEDAQAAEILDGKLQTMGIQRSYAVPGTMLEANPSVYKKIAARGCEFLNHGYLPHTQLQDGAYRSTTFYGQMDPTLVIQDVQQGHQTVQSIIGKKPAGFRAPHFGKVSLRMQKEMIRPVLRELGEFYSTQTTPFVAMEHGPVWLENNWPEFPLVGSTLAPYSVLDSYSYIQSPSIRKVTDQFSRVLKLTIKQLQEWNIHGLLNFYVDPSHVVEDAGFMDAMQLVKEAGISSLTYTQSLEIGIQDLLI
jgi:hypothetical protein